jgi:RHS repeat-associated protein
LGTPFGPSGPGGTRLPAFGYRGELALGPTIYLRARNYDSSLGRFTAPDPLLVPPEPGLPPNPYAYAASDPLNCTDPSGLLLMPAAPGPGAQLGEAVGAAISAAEAIARAAAAATAALTSALRPPAARGINDLTISVTRESLPPLPGIGQYGLEIARCDLYLDDALTVELVNGLQIGASTVLYVVFGLATGAHLTATSLAKVFGAEALGAFAEAVGYALEAATVALAGAWAYGEYLSLVNSSGGDMGVVIHFFLWRSWHRIPVPTWAGIIPFFHLSATVWGPWQTVNVPLPPPLGLISGVHIPASYATAQ